MKYLVVADIHGSEYYMDKMFKVFNNTNCDKLIVLGDFLYHGPRNDIPEGYNPKNLAIKFNNFNKEIIAVRGNCDAEVDQMVLDFNIMDENKIIDINGSKAFLTHGHHFNEDNMPEGEFDLFINGHTHLPVLKRENNIVFLNPGSITLPKQDNPNTYAIIYENKITIYDTDNNVFKELEL
jgi:putative phosphoesterase